MLAHPYSVTLTPYFQQDIMLLYYARCWYTAVARTGMPGALKNIMKKQAREYRVPGRSFTTYFVRNRTFFFPCIFYVRTWF